MYRSHSAFDKRLPPSCRVRKGRDSNGDLLCLPPQAVCQPTLRRTAQECPVRTSLDLELDLQASLTRQSRLNDELQALRDLRQKLEELKAQGETDLPPGVLEDERFQKLLKQAEKQVRSSGSYQEGNGQQVTGTLVEGPSIGSSHPFPRTGVRPPRHYGVLPTQIIAAVVLCAQPQAAL